MSWKSIRAKRVAVTIVAVAVSLASSKTSYAAPTSLTQTQFNTAAGASALVEDFEGFSVGLTSNPFVFANGRYSTPNNPAVVNVPALGPTQRLVTNNELDDLRTFDLFPSGTTLVGMDLFYYDPLDLFHITVTGGSGILNISQDGSSLGAFLGFQDLLGIASITFSNQGLAGGGISNYSFDNIQTASGSEVPEPTSMALFGLTALGMGVMRRRKKKATEELV